MNRLAKTVAILLVCIALMPTSLQAQFQLNLTGNYLIPIQSGGSFDNGQWGPEVTLRYFTSPHLAIGLNARYSTKSSSTEFPSQSLSARDKFTSISITGRVDYFFTQSALQPYVGLEAGLYKTRFKNEITGATAYTVAFNDHYFLIGPKLGLQYRIIPSLGIDLAASYQLVPDRGSIDKTLLLGGGVFFNFGNR